MERNSAPAGFLFSREGAGMALSAATWWRMGAGPPPWSGLPPPGGPLAPGLLQKMAWLSISSSLCKLAPSGNENFPHPPHRPSGCSHEGPLALGQPCCRGRGVEASRLLSSQPPALSMPSCAAGSSAWRPLLWAAGNSAHGGWAVGLGSLQLLSRGRGGHELG